MLNSLAPPRALLPDFASSPAQFRIDLVDRPHALWPYAPPALVPVLPPLILKGRTQLHA